MLAHYKYIYTINIGVLVPCMRYLLVNKNLGTIINKKEKIKERKT